MINIFGSKKKKDTVDFVLNTVKEAGDKLFFTKEEKAENLKQAWDGVCKFVENTLGESSVRSVTRRYLALGHCVCVFRVVCFLGSHSIL